MDLGEREYRCEICGRVLQRDGNAARNLEQWWTDPTSRKLRRVPPEETPVERAEDLSVSGSHRGSRNQTSICLEQVCVSSGERI